VNAVFVMVVHVIANAGAKQENGRIDGFRHHNRPQPTEDRVDGDGDDDRDNQDRSNDLNSKKPLDDRGPAYSLIPMWMKSVAMMAMNPRKERDAEL
jgi:hypothetical protein